MSTKEAVHGFTMWLFALVGVLAGAELALELELESAFAAVPLIFACAFAGVIFGHFFFRLFEGID